MKPYFETENGVLYCNDGLKVMKSFKDEFIDLTITSPPYDNLRNYNGYDLDINKIIKELFRITKVGGVVVWVVGDSTIKGSETGSSFKQALEFINVGFNLHDTMIYEKNGPAYPSKNRYYSIFEYMFVFSRSGPEVFNPIKDRKNRWAGQKWSNKRSRRNVNGDLKSSSWEANQGGEYGTRFNIWRYNVGHGYSTKDKIAYEHPAIFPEKLAEDHILSWSNEGGQVFDLFNGSGTTFKMSLKNNRKFIGSEISEKYCEITKKRIKQATAQRSLPGF